MITRTIRLSIVVAGLSALLGPAVAAAGLEEQRSLMEQVRQEDEQREARWTGLFRVRAGVPQTLSAGPGLIRAKLPKSWECVTACALRGMVLQVEPGIRGVQLSAGYATLVAEQRHNKRFLSDVYLAFGVKGVVLRKWDRAGQTGSERTFAGVELSYTVTRVNFSIGVLRRVERVPGEDWIVSAGMGWGF